MAGVVAATVKPHVDNEMSEEERAKQERLNIVGQYAKGPRADDDDEMENRNAPYIPDQYGFLLNAEPAALSKQEEDRRRQVEVKRRTKWLKMVRHWDKYVGSEKLAKRVYKGIPQGMRGDVWKLLLEVYRYMDTMPHVYQEMKTSAHSHSNDIRQIDLDVNRTYRDHDMFRKRYSIKQQQLFHVLAAYSMYNTEVGYCQGMSQIAALLLMYMSEEEAFWALHSLLYGAKHKMHGFFIPGFPKLMRFQEHHDRILKKLMPKLKKHLDANEVFASLYTMKWFFQCFLDRSPFSLTLRLWDIYTLEGEKLLISMSYATLKLHKVYLKSQEMDGIVSFLQEQLVIDFGASDDVVVEHLKACMIDLRRSSLDRPAEATDAEKPKLPFGSLIPSPENSARSKVPEFAKHAVDIDTLLPELKRKGSVKKKREKVKRGKSAVGKNATPANGTDRSDIYPIKGTKPIKDPDQITRSPFLRGSFAKRGKTEKVKNAKSPLTLPKNSEAKQKEDGKKKSKGGQNSPETRPKNEKLKETHASESSGTETRTNGISSAVKLETAVRNGAESNLPRKRGQNSGSSGVAENDRQLDTNENTNSLKSNSKHKNGERSPILTTTSPSVSSMSRTSEQTTSSGETPSPNKVVSKRIPQNHEKLNSQHGSDNPSLKNEVLDDEPDSHVAETESSAKKQEERAQWTAESVDPSLKPESSFAQLSAAEITGRDHSRGFGTPGKASGRATSPSYQSAFARPHSFYDNVPFDNISRDYSDQAARVSLSSLARVVEVGGYDRYGS